MKKNTLSQKLAKYTAMAAAIGGITDASGQIIYTDIDPDIQGNWGSSHVLDLDNDSNWDFGIRNSYSVIYNTNCTSICTYVSQYSTYCYPYCSYTNPIFSNNRLILSAPSGNSIALNNSVYTAAILNSGETISSGMDWSPYPGYLAQDYGGYWYGETDKFVGLKFKIGNNTHYGWARLSVLVPHLYTIKDYAYNATPDEWINAGQTLSIDEHSTPDTYNVSCNENIIYISNIKGEAKYNIYNLSGKLVIEGATQLESQSIDASHLSAGIYVVEVKGVTSNALARKKIIIK